MVGIHDASEPIVGGALHLLEPIVDLGQICWLFLLENWLFRRSFLIGIHTFVDFLSEVPRLRVSSMVYSLFQRVDWLVADAARWIVNIQIPQKLRTKSPLHSVVYTFGRDRAMLPIEFGEYLYVFVRKFIFHLFAWIIFFNYLNKLAVCDFGVNLLFKFLKSLGISLLPVHEIVDHRIN